MNTLLKHYTISTELEKFLVAERLWTTTYASTEDMTKYTNQFADTWRDIVRLKKPLPLRFLVPGQGKNLSQSEQGLAQILHVFVVFW
jgi:hypothetical protein